MIARLTLGMAAGATTNCVHPVCCTFFLSFFLVQKEIQVLCCVKFALPAFSWLHHLSCGNLLVVMSQGELIPHPGL